MKIKSDNRGFTFIEVIVSVGIFTVIMLAMSALFLSLYRQQGSDIGMIQRIQSANAALDKMSKELREANRGENGNFTISNATNTSLTFYSDVDGDNLTEKITYALQGTNLQRTVVEPGAGSAYPGAGATATVCSGIKAGSATIFTYYDDTYTGSGNPLSAPVSVTSVKVVGISLDLNSTGQSSYPLHVETKVELRNLK
jgi:prepilin-type N-terminal cleavage/methylation domain-containing protein